jgi:hypothetical protein
VTATWQRVSTWFTPLKGIDPYVELAVHLTPLFYFSRLELASSPPPAEPVAPSPFPPPLPAPVFPPLPSIAFPRLSILLRLNNLSPKEFAEGEKGGKPIYETNLGTARWSDIVQVPSLYSGLADDGNTIWRYCAARVTAKFFDMIRGDSLLQSYIYRLSLGLPFSKDPPPAAQVDLPQHPQFAPPRLPPAVVVGVIDDGLAVANQRFRDRDGGTRVQYLWVQDGNGTKPPAPTPPHGPPVSTGAPFPGSTGWQFSKAEIDAFMKYYAKDGAVDEDALYRALGIIDYRLYSHQAAAQSIAHGTHVMDQACGGDPSTVDPKRPARPIVAVQLPTRTTATSSGADLAPHVAEAIDYILYCSDQIAQLYKVSSLPVVINFSYGRYAGPHDGTHLLEQLIDRRIAQRESYGRNGRLRVVLPAGNNYLPQGHAQLTFGSNASLSVTWRQQPDSRTPGYLEIWLPEDGGATAPSGSLQSRLSISLTPPGGGPSMTLGEDPNNALQLLNSDGYAVGAVVYAPTAPQTKRPMFLVALAPTASVEGKPLGSAGEWTVTLANDATHGLGPNERIHAWVERNSAPLGYPPLGRQSRFDDKNYDYDISYDLGGLEIDAPRPIETDDAASYVRRFGTINAYGTGESAIVIGGYERRSRIVAHYSAAGPALPHTGYTSSFHRIGPDALVPADDSDAHLGILGAGVRSNSVVAMDGTSVAAPQVARLVADLLAKGDKADADQIQKAAAYAEAHPPPDLPNPVLPFGRPRDGAGRLPLPPVVKFKR